MALKIENISKISENIRNILSEQCNDTLAIIADNAQEIPHETIHEVRKCFKKIRAVLRLVRDATDQYHSENQFFRDEARKISEIRDAAAIIEALDVLYNQHSDKLYKNVFAAIRADLEKRKTALEKEMLAKQNILQEIYANTRPKCSELRQLPLAIDTYKSISDGIELTYSRGRKAYRKSSEVRSAENLHEWRKRVKYLRYQLDVINAIWPRLLTVWEKELHELSDCLGTDRDLYLLKNVIDENGKKRESESNRYLLRTLLEGHRDQLQQHALLLGEKLYHLKPATLVSLLEAAWSAELSGASPSLMPPEELEK